MNFAYGVVCSKAIINQRTEQLSIIDIIDQVQVENLPTMLPNVAIVTFWTRDRGTEGSELLKVRMRREPELSTDLVESTGYTQPEFEQPIPSSSLTARMVLDVNAIFLTNDGVNKFIFEINDGNEWTDAGSVMLNVQVGTAPSDITRSPASVVE